ncbi:MAG: hypothetical protein FRX48_08249 [Lasallia pustulata]|uniref:TMEM205-like domain-containing protein n=1 Tax=Lasallia pustulata TaxID=136370 RepID=A0A1W5D2E7_9LECA|nr:MAG: hypothetical protein FRX48_08249 [Lasallia pustulata]SLM37328.1 Domain of unknown function DUF4149 [Lasallia pustulata]
MLDLSILTTPAPYHIITYGTLLGTQFFQSFVGGIVAYKALPRPQFSSLQQAIFPIYFSMQTALPVVLALTVPGEMTPLGRTPSGLGGFLAEKNRTGVLVPILTTFATSLTNLLFIGPATTRIMRERKHQETRDGKKSYDSPPHSKEMARMNKQFARMHGISSLLNVGGLLATVWYGITIAERLQ